MCLAHISKMCQTFWNGGSIIRHFQTEGVLFYGHINITNMPIILVDFWPYGRTLRAYFWLCKLRFAHFKIIF